MQLTINQRYLKLPITRELQPKRLLFKKDGRVIADIITTVDPKHPQLWYYWDMRELMGQTLELEWDSAIDYIPDFTDTVPMDSIYQERYRPTAHFTAARGWINDPNGLVYYEGQYHMFFQHNPVAPVWGNMHWGHAVSTDLLHWEEKEIALFPDDLGTMFSGSAFVDQKNATGLKVGDHDPLLLFYTAAENTSAASQGRKFTQCLAYSTDGGITFQKYKHNPIVPHIAGDNRDPKVIYNPEDRTYYMALYLMDNEYALLTSDNLLNWTISQKLTLPEDAECPDFYPMATASGKKYWIFTGASDRYLVGELKNHQFMPVQDSHSLQAISSQAPCMSYAAQTFSNVPGDRILRISWNRSSIPGSIFNSSMCTPAEMTLKETKGGLLLCINPIVQFNGLAANESVTTRPEISLTGTSHDITLSFHTGTNANISVSFLGLDMQISTAKNCLKVKNVTLPVFSEDGKIHLRFVTDIHAVEIYAADGQAFACIEHIADYNLDQLAVHTDQGELHSLHIKSAQLNSIWNC